MYISSGFPTILLALNHPVDFVNGLICPTAVVCYPRFSQCYKCFNYHRGSNLWRRVHRSQSRCWPMTGLRAEHGSFEFIRPFGRTRWNRRDSLWLICWESYRRRTEWQPGHRYPAGLLKGLHYRGAIFEICRRSCCNVSASRLPK